MRSWKKALWIGAPQVFAVSACLLAVPASAAPGPASPQTGPRYFIDFRARPSTYIGHTFIVYGRLGSDGRPVERNYAGLIPERAAWRGLLFPIRGTVRKYKDDVLQPATASYRRTLTAAQYARVVATVRQMNASVRLWHAFFLNCNDFAIEIAEELGLARPPSLLPPDVWVTGLRLLNRR